MAAIEQAELQLSIQIENLLVAMNPRGMKNVKDALAPGYYLRAAQLLKGLTGTILIGTGFPVADTFETDGPVGAIALYNALETLGAQPILVSGEPFVTASENDFRVHKLIDGDLINAKQEAIGSLAKLQPQAVISIERPGLAEQGLYFNMHGEDISDNCACFDHYLNESNCPTIAIGDGGNEIGMGNIIPALSKLDITPAITTCDELLIADVSNWGAYGIIAFLAKWANIDLLAEVDSLALLQYVSDRGSVDGVTRENNLTEDSFPATFADELILNLRKLTHFI
ncbi:glutamate cyclase domain-containing protein [Thalassotalea sp. ND16A]|uniref:glutamate cyclase domain-containing protein n=1 Tax=Thalassotalea sp. ND16A TaxID=1535422 RepID=UPI00051A1B5E|nr:glutamate cyclase domain-containing protein [Thalassotalea sp. ND16A]KGJ96043.1 hypothetical protein ND16A_1102 [Thalassotalea sp. ND16A]